MTPFERIEKATVTRREFVRRLGIGGAALAMPPLLAACGGGGEAETSSGEAATGGSAAGGGAGDIDALRVMVDAPIEQLDIVNQYDGTEIFATRVGVESLVTYNESVELVPLLAESWEQPDDTTYVYTIRSGVTFWDGSPLTADDVVASLERHLDPSSQTHFNWAGVSSIEQTGDMEVTITIEQPDVFFQYVLVLPEILPRAFIEEHGDDIGTPAVGTMGTGAYTIDDYAPDSGITWVRREDGYWGEQPPVRQIELAVIEEPATQLLAVRSGDIDVATFSVEQAAEWEGIDGVDVSFAPDLVTIYFSFDVEAEPWSDPHVRRAVAHALDREGLIQALFDGRADPATTIVPPVQWGGLASPEEVERIYAELPSYEFDLDRARDELRQSSVPDGFEASVDISSAFAPYGRIALNLRENLAQIGIDLTVNELSDEQHEENRFTRNSLAFRLDAIGADYPDPANFLDLMLASASAVENGWNSANYRNPEVDRLLEEQATMTDLAARVPLITEILRFAAEDLPYIGVYHPVFGLAVRDGLDVDVYALSVYEGLGQRVNAS